MTTVLQLPWALLQSPVRLRAVPSTFPRFRPRPSSPRPRHSSQPSESLATCNWIPSFAHPSFSNHQLHAVFPWTLMFILASVHHRREPLNLFASASSDLAGTRFCWQYGWALLLQVPPHTRIQVNTLSRICILRCTLSPDCDDSSFARPARTSCLCC